jgi:hypothetical protein
MDRRAFIFGTTALIASSSLALKAAGKVLPYENVAILDPRVPFRAVSDLLLCNHPSGEDFRTEGYREDPTRFTVKRGDNPVVQFLLNPRASQRWVAAPMEELICRHDAGLFTIEIEPLHRNCSVSVVSYVSPDYWERDFSGYPRKRQPMVSEVFDWSSGKLKQTIAMINPVDQHLLDNADFASLGDIPPLTRKQRRFGLIGS